MVHPSSLNVYQEDYCPGSQYGTIHLKEFLYLAIVHCPTIVFATMGPGGGVLGGVVGGVIGYHYKTSKYIVICYTCME